MGTLPESKTAWPPAEHTRRYSQMRTCSVWYAGDPALLSSHYAASHAGRPGFVQRVANWFWGRGPQQTVDDKLHIDVPRELATFSSELLFAETPRFEVQYTQFQADGTPDPAQGEQVKRAQARLDDLLDRMNFGATLLAAAETCAALGSVGLRIAYDKRDGGDYPVIVRADADAVVPEYRWGQLDAVTFWRTQRQGETVWYHLERHERGFIEHGLYRGADGNLGQRMPLADHPMTAPLAPLVNAESRIVTVDRLTAVSVPNLLPDPLDRTSSVGRSDFSPGVITLFDQLDRTYTSLARDFEDGQSRLLIADYMLKTGKPGEGVEWDPAQRVFTTLKREPGEAGDPPIDQVQFRIRVQEHLQAIEALRNAVLKEAGYNSDADRGEAGGEMTATEYQGRNERSIRTRNKKLRYWAVVEELLQALLQVDATYFGSGITALPVRMIPAAPVQPSLKELAEVAESLLRTEAASLETRVRALHPDWDEDQLVEELEKIQAEAPQSPDTFGLPGAPLDGVEVEDAAELRSKADAMGVLIRAGVEPQDAAARVGLSGVRFTGAVPTSLRLPESDAAQLEGP